MPEIAVKMLPDSGRGNKMFLPHCNTLQSSLYVRFSMDTNASRQEQARFQQHRDTLQQLRCYGDLRSHQEGTKEVVLRRGIHGWLAASRLLRR